jgi:hypothetical protein
MVRLYQKKYWRTLADPITELDVSAALWIDTIEVFAPLAGGRVVEMPYELAMRESA